MSMIGRLMPSLSERWYSVVEDRSEQRFSFQTVYLDSHLMAEAAAEDYWDNHDGYNATWPRTFVLYKYEDDEQPHATVTMDMETSPSFFVVGELPPAADAVDPSADSNSGNLSTRDKSSIQPSDVKRGE